MESLSAPKLLSFILFAVRDAVDNYALIVGDHALDVVPAVDGYRLTEVKGVILIASFILIPAAVIVVAFNNIVASSTGGRGVVLRYQFIEVIFSGAILAAHLYIVKRYGLHRRLSVAILIDLQHNRLGLQSSFFPNSRKGNICVGHGKLTIINYYIISGPYIENVPIAGWNIFRYSVFVACKRICNICRHTANFVFTTGLIRYGKILFLIRYIVVVKVSL